MLSVLLFLCMYLASCGFLSKESELRSAEAPKEAAAPELKGPPIAYTTKILVQGEKKEAQELKSLMEQASMLVVHKDKAPDSILGLELRARTDKETAVKLLQAQCYYEGTCDYSLDETSKPVEVVLTLKPGVRYKLGVAKLRYEPQPKVPPSFKNRYRTYGLLGLEREELPAPKFPKELPNVQPGKPITADAMLTAVEAFPETLHTRGFPLAKVEDAIYTLDPEAKTLNAEIIINPGPAAFFGDLKVTGNKAVKTSYFFASVPWTIGKEPFDLDQLEDYANELRQSGLFRSVEAKPQALSKEVTSETGSSNVVTLPVEIKVQEAPFRTVGANVHYDTASGFGVEGSWEHRNLFGGGEKLTITAPVGTQEQALKMAFEKPNFGTREQKLTGEAKFSHENTDAYERTGVYLGTGLERRLSKHWWGGAGLFYEGGSLKDNQNSQQNYSAYGPTFSLRHDSRNNPLNPTQGAVFKWTVKPFAGSYTKDFTALAQTMGASFFYAPFRDNDGAKTDDLVLAARVEGGSILGPKRSVLPTSMRYFTGGAGSIRGYVYQAVGPRDNEEEPNGGRSYQLVNLEARIKVTKDVGIVPFVDGGMVYTDQVPQIIGDMRWGGGLGLRYYTPIGPVRLDVATPFNPIEGDSPVQIYVSIGQAF
ncbi:MAG: BamA/TamA family outer membrane protein [Desulfovibrionaceae bacterium]|nr:BamA/TamA family outer membrane protein [Desulfovibrionaceae bacterium]